MHHDCRTAYQQQASYRVQYLALSACTVSLFNERTNVNSWIMQCATVVHRSNAARHSYKQGLTSALLQLPEAAAAEAIFCHVDTRGAAMNDGVSSRYTP
jgi:hypothetical protein